MTASRPKRLSGVKWLPTGDPDPLPTLLTTAYANDVVFDAYVVRGIFSTRENVTMIWDLIVAEMQSSQDCAEWNATMDEYDATKDALAAAANEETNELDGERDTEHNDEVTQDDPKHDALSRGSSL